MKITFGTHGHPPLKTPPETSISWFGVWQIGGTGAEPLSDQAIVKKLDETGFKVARRTIAKYREELKILPSHLRKGFKV